MRSSGTAISNPRRPPLTKTVSKLTAAIPHGIFLRANFPHLRNPL
jgi:hypothetical protein